jgi:hypothetical protein
MNEHLNDPGMEHVTRALAAVREASSDRRAPESVEAVLLESFRAHHERPTQVKSVRTRRYAWIAAAIAASVAIVAVVRISRTPSVTAPERPFISKAPAPEQVVPQAVQSTAARVRPKPRPRPAPPGVSASARERREVTTDFFPIPYAPAMTQADYGQVIRVNVPANSMRTFGLPVREDRMFDRVQADVLMGEDGIARAIRFVRQQNSGLNFR